MDDTTTNNELYFLVHKACADCEPFVLIQTASQKKRLLIADKNGLASLRGEAEGLVKQWGGSIKLVRVVKVEELEEFR